MSGVKEECNYYRDEGECYNFRSKMSGGCEKEAFSVREER